MNKHQQSGMTTLLITSMLLIVALLFSLASYKNLFYQIKRTQNEVLARQAHWAAEGGLECGFSQIQKARNISDAKPTFIDCKSTLNLADVNVSIDDESYINSEYVGISNKIIKKKINLSSRLAGAIQSRSNLELIGDYEIFPDVEGKHDNGDYKCVSIRYSNRFIFDKTGPGNLTTELEVKDPIKNGPYSGFDGKCATGYRSYLKVTTDSFDNNTKDNLKNDFVYDSDFDPFESFFGDKVSELDKIKKEFDVIAGSKSDDINERCDYLISKAFELNDKVWVEGDCDLLDASNLNSMEPIDKAKPKVLVIENGIVATWGVSEFIGVLYHYIDGNSNIYNGTELDSRWKSMPSYNYNHGNNTVKDLVVYNSVFINGGSFRPSGGMIFDTLNGHTTLTSGMVLSFTNEANPISPEQKISWQQGSWHDF